jgi:SAM-dependent methyltransferase
MTRSQFFAYGAAAFTSFLAGGSSASAHQPIDKEKLEFFEREDVVVEDFPAKGFVLDIGGGGEGVIGQLKGPQVVAIDLSKKELEGAPSGPLKIVMDATELKFLDASFETVTAFFSFMYMPPEVREKALKEIDRVLTPAGKFLLWDPIVPAQKDPKKEYAVFRYTFKLPATEIKTGYGTPYRPYVRDAAYHIGSAERAGFRVVRRRQQGRTFFIEFAKA